MTTTAVSTNPDHDVVRDPARLDAVAATGLIGGAPSPVLDELTGLAMRLIGGRVALMNLVEGDRQSHVSLSGPPLGTGLRHVPRSHSYCQYVVATGVPLVVGDAREHPLLRHNPAIAAYQAVAYLGVPVRSPSGHIVGTLCVYGTEPRSWQESDVATLTALATAAGSEVARRMAADEAERGQSDVRWMVDGTGDAFVQTDTRGVITCWNTAAERIFGRSTGETTGQPAVEMIIAPEQREIFSHWISELNGRPGWTHREFLGAHRQGRRFPIEISAAVRSHNGIPATYAFVRDISLVRRREQLRRLEYAVSGALAAAETAEHAAEAVVARVGEGLVWPYVEYWHLDPDDGRQLIRVADWSRDSQSTTPMRNTREYGRGCGVVDKVFESKAARWSTDLGTSETPRAPAAKASGLNTVVAVPVRNGPDVVGVLAIFDRRVVDPEPDLMAALDSVAAHIGQYVHRRRAVDLELELSRARRHFDQIVSNLSDFLWTVRITSDGAVRLVYASPNNTAVFGGPGPSGGDLSRAMAAMIHPEDVEIFLDFRDTLVAGQPAQVACRLIGGDGVARWVWTRGQPRRENGVLYVDGVCSDVTDRHHDNARLRQLAELLDLAPTAAVVVRDLDGRITYWNKGAEHVYGWNAASVIGRGIHKLLDTRFPVGQEAVEQQLLATGEWSGELDHLRSDGTRIVVLSHQGVQYDDDGQPVAYLEVNVDVTARKQAERQLADSEKRLRTQFSLVTVGQAALSLDGRLQQVNPALADILGRTAADLEGRTLDEITHPDDRAENDRTAAYMFTEDVPTGRYLRLLHTSGFVVDVEIGMSLVRDTEGQPVSFIAVIQDVTARLAAERERDAAATLLGIRNDELQDTNAQLAAANALKLDLMGMLSHEIGTPLNTIIGYTEVLLADTAHLDQGQRKPLDVIARSAQRLNHLRAEILTMCTIDAGRLQASPEPVPLAAALADTLAGLDLDVPVDCPDGLVVLVHPSHLQQIVTNFCTNAAKYAGGVTRITVSRRDNRAFITVHDNGPGISPQLRPALFDRFTRASGGDPAVQGHGLGLYIVRGLAEANDGTVGYQPGHPTGSQFTLGLPLKP
ncbi:MAG TPA: PAS domain S-box protein [Actinoplanes sp.]|nr:PAS domain S-box protein [Actinoplanes sp.]